MYSYTDIGLEKKQAPTPVTNKEDMSTLVQSFLTRGMSAVIRCKLEALSEMCAHLGLTAVGSGKGGRIVRDDCLRALQNSTALVRVCLKESRNETNLCKANQPEGST